MQTRLVFSLKFRLGIEEQIVKSVLDSGVMHEEMRTSMQHPSAQRVHCNGEEISCGRGAHCFIIVTPPTHTHSISLSLLSRSRHNSKHLARQYIHTNTKKHITINKRWKTRRATWSRGSSSLLSSDCEGEASMAAARCGINIIIMSSQLARAAYMHFA
jgi:hypothetical protein